MYFFLIYRWKYANCSITFSTSDKNAKDLQIINGFNKMIESVFEKFTTDTRKNIIKYKNKKV